MKTGSAWFAVAAVLTVLGATARAVEPGLRGERLDVISDTHSVENICIGVVR